MRFGSPHESKGQHARPGSMGSGGDSDCSDREIKQVYLPKKDLQNKRTVILFFYNDHVFANNKRVIAAALEGSFKFSQKLERCDVLFSENLHCLDRLFGRSQTDELLTQKHAPVIAVADNSLKVRHRHQKESQEKEFKDKEKEKETQSLSTSKEKISPGCSVVNIQYFDRKAEELGIKAQIAELLKDKDTKYQVVVDEKGTKQFLTLMEAVTATVKSHVEKKKDALSKKGISEKDYEENDCMPFVIAALPLIPTAVALGYDAAQCFDPMSPAFQWIFQHFVVRTGANFTWQELATTQNVTFLPDAGSSQVVVAAEAEEDSLKAKSEYRVGCKGDDFLQKADDFLRRAAFADLKAELIGLANIVSDSLQRMEKNAKPGDSRTLILYCSVLLSSKFVMREAVSDVDVFFRPASGAVPISTKKGLSGYIEKVSLGSPLHSLSEEKTGADNLLMMGFYSATEAVRRRLNVLNEKMRKISDVNSEQTWQLIQLFQFVLENVSIDLLNALNSTVKEDDPSYFIAQNGYSMWQTPARFNPAPPMSSRTGTSLPRSANVFGC